MSTAPVMAAQDEAPARSLIVEPHKQPWRWTIPVSQKVRIREHDLDSYAQSGQEANSVHKVGPASSTSRIFVPAKFWW